MTDKLKRAARRDGSSEPIVGVRNSSHPVQSLDLDTISMWDTHQVDWPGVLSQKKAKNPVHTVEVRQKFRGVPAMATGALDGWA